MIDVKEKYPEIQDGKYGVKNGPGYEGICALFGEVLVEVVQDDYQGDTWVLLKKDDHFGILQFGWGSCSGCDALQGCDKVSELQELINDLEASVKWFDKDDDVIEYLLTHDWKGDYSFRCSQLRRFPNKALVALGSKHRIADEYWNSED